MKNHSTRSTLCSVLAAAIVSVASMPFVSSGCDDFVFDSPPRGEIQGLVDNQLTSLDAPLVITFSEPVDEATLHVRLVLLEVDDDGNLPDEREGELKGENVQFFEFDGKAKTTTGGVGTLSEDRKTFSIDLMGTAPIGPSLAILIEQGLADDEGNAWEVRQRLVFAYSLGCDQSGAPTVFPSGYYFFIADITKPLGVQIQLLAYLDVDPLTGSFVGQFTNADRNMDGSRCDPPCGSDDACQTIPMEACVIPSTKVGSEDEYPDFVGNPAGTTGFTFEVKGCVVDTEGGTVFVNAPADIQITNPNVLVEGIKLSAQFADVDGAFRGTGVSGANQVFLGTSPAGPAEGTMLGRLIPEGEVPIDVPKP